MRRNPNGVRINCALCHVAYEKISFFLCVFFRVLTTYNRVFENRHENCSDTPRKLGTLRALHEPLPNPSAILYHLAQNTLTHTQHITIPHNALSQRRAFFICIHLLDVLSRSRTQHACSLPYTHIHTPAHSLLICTINWRSFSPVRRSIMG